jgi:hypothetical protein
MEDLIVPKQFLDQLMDGLPNVKDFKGSSITKSFSYDSKKFELEFYVVKDSYENIRWHYSPFEIKQY